MRRAFAFQRNRYGLFIAAAALFLAAWAAAPLSVSAQGKSKKPAADAKRSGKIAEVEKKGKSATLRVEESDGETFDVLIAPKTKFVVNGKGDAAFFKHPHLSASSESVVMNAGNNYLFGKKFTVYLGSNQPDPRFEKDAISPEVCHIAGPVVDADDESFTINVEGTPYKVNFEKGVAPDVSVVSTDPAHATVGSEIEVEGTTRAGKFHPSSVVVNLDRPMVEEEVFATEKGDKKGPKSKAAGSKGKTPKKARSDKTNQGDGGEGGISGDAPEGDPIKSGGDPFNVLTNKKGKATKKSTKPVPKAKNPFENGDSDS